MSVTIGALRQRMRLEQQIRVSDSAGGAVVTWTLIGEVWGSLDPLSGSEGVDSGAIQGRVTHEIWLRYRGGVTPGMRLVLGSRIFDVQSAVDMGERHRHLRCLVEERVA